MKKILGTLEDEGLYIMFTNMIKASDDVRSTLEEEGPFTVFAPTDEAFNALPDGQADSILLDPDRLADVLEYHIVRGLYLVEDLKTMTSVDNENGDSMVITGGSPVTVDEARIVEEDVRCANGVIQGIDLMLIPSNEPEQPRSSMY